MATVRMLHSDDLTDLAAPSEYVDAVRAAYRERGAGAPAAPRTLLEAADPPGVLTGYLAVLPDTGAMGGYTYAAGFADRDAHFMLPLFDAETGAPLAILDGASLNPYKTGAVGAVGTDTLARADATRLAVIGSGTQARGQLRATAAVRELDHVAVYSPTPDHREAFASEEGARLDVPVEPVASPGAAVREADIVVTATTASEPVFDGRQLAPGTHVTAVGQYHPDRRELDADTIARSKYVPDLRARADQDAGSYIAAREAGAINDDHVHAELGEVLTGGQPGRTGEEITVFDSGGTAIETVAAGKLLYDKAVERGLGETVEFAPASEAM